MIIYINPENRCVKEIFEGMSDDTIEYVHQAFQYYCDIIENSRVDMECIEALDNLERLERTGKLYGSREYRDEFDGGREKGVAWFMSKAIEIYCSNCRKAGTSAGMISQEGG